MSDHDRPAGEAKRRVDGPDSADINWKLLETLATKPHRLLNIADDIEKQIRETPIAWTGEVFQEARSAHHLLDMMGIPQGKGYSSNVDARTFRALLLVQGLKERLDRLSSWHTQETGPGGTVGSFCVECGHLWPCDSRLMAEGKYEDADDDEAGPEVIASA